MKRTSLPPQTVPTPPISTRASSGAKRVSFECDGPITNICQSSSSYQSTSLPSSSTLLAYKPFSAFEDDVTECHQQGYKYRALKNEVPQETQGPIIVPERPASAEAIHPRAKRSSTTSVKEQRRYSSEDGTTTCQPEQGVIIPTKCRMVFHMRNEVSKIRCPSEEDKTGLSEKRGGFAPQQQPRQYQRPISPKKTGSSKRVSFKEEPEVIAAVATAVESLAVVSQEDPELNSTETKSYEAVIQPAVDSLVRSSSTSYTSTQSNQSRSSYVLQRNMSAPSISAFAPSTINSNKECSQPQKGSKSSSGNRISKLWKSVAQKYGHGHGIRADHGSSVMVGREPLVV